MEFFAILIIILFVVVVGGLAIDSYKADKERIRLINNPSDVILAYRNSLESNKLEEWNIIFEDECSWHRASPINKNVIIEFSSFFPPSIPHKTRKLLSPLEEEVIDGLVREYSNQFFQRAKDRKRKEIVDGR